MMFWSSMQEITLKDLPQRLQTSMSILKTRLSRWVHICYFQAIQGRQ